MEVFMIYDLGMSSGVAATAGSCCSTATWSPSWQPPSPSWRSSTPGTVQRSTVQYSTVQYSAVQCSTTVLLQATGGHPARHRDVAAVPRDVRQVAASIFTSDEYYILYL